MDDKSPLYNSRIIKTYLEYLGKYYPDIDVDSILKYAEMTRHEVEDPAHWFSQRQTDRFHEALALKTDNPHIARDAGRYTASAEAYGTIKTYILGLLTPATAYGILEKIASTLSRHMTFKTRKLGHNKVEVLSIQKPGVHEKPYQCENRMGMLESMAEPYTKKYATIEHDKCVHRGGDCCRYIITWEKTASLIWKRVRNISLLFGLFASIPSFFILPHVTWVIFITLYVFFVMALSLYSGHIEKMELTKTIETQGDIARDLIDETNMRYSDALLIQELGRATSTILDIDSLSNTVMGIMEKRLDFDRGIIMLANSEKSRLLYTAGYGYDKQQEELLQRTGFHLDKPESMGLMTGAFREQKSFLVDDISEIEKMLSERSQNWVKELGIHSLICVPIVYEKESIGVLGVDNAESKRPFIQSDLNLLTGIASQIAISITNAGSFQKLRESEEWFNIMASSAQDAIITMDGNGNIMYWNDAAEKIFGYTEEEALGNELHAFLAPEKYHEAYKRSFLRFKETGQGAAVGKTLELTALKKDGKEFPIELSLSAVKIKDLWNSIGIIRDITERKQAEEEKRELEASLHQARKMESIGTLAGGIAHDFNNLLMGMQGNVSLMLLNTDPGHPNYKKLKTIEQHVQSGAELTSQLLGFARGGKYEVKPTDLNSLIRKTSEILGRTKKEVTIHEKYQKDIWTVEADQGQMEQVLLNLYLNASQAMPGGGELYLQTENVTIDKKYTKPHNIEPGNYAKISVTDTGTGMDEATRQKIFDPFFTSKKMGSVKGTGLGLASAYGIIKNHGGIIDVYSEKGAGSTFNIYLPASEAVIGDQEAEIREEKIPTGHETVLFVDDEEMIIDVSKEMLKTLGYEVLTARNGREAIEVYKENRDRIDIVIMDMIMPEMGGGEAYDRLKEINPDIKVLLSSGYSINGQAKEILERGCNGFVQKPYSIKDLSRTIREVLDKDQP